MKKSDKNNKKESENKISRGQFFSKMGIGAISATIAGSGIFLLDFLSPNVVLEQSPIFKAGNVENYSPDSVTLDPKNRVFIVREKEGYLYAVSAVCTHLGCLTKWNEEEGMITCPCHGSKFEKTGNVLDGPAPNALSRFHISLSEKNEIIIDKSIIVDENQILKV